MRGMLEVDVMGQKLKLTVTKLIYTNILLMIRTVSNFL